jgi:sialate O-acetylesterase
MNPCYPLFSLVGFSCLRRTLARLLCLLVGLGGALVSGSAQEPNRGAEPIPLMLTTTGLRQVKVDGVPGWVASPPKGGGKARLWLANIDDSRFKAGQAREVTVTLRYLDRFSVPVRLEYDAPGTPGRWTPLPAFTTGETGEWREHRWEIPAPQFQSRAWQHDLRVVVDADVDFVIGGLTATGRSTAEVILPDIFSSGMVVQRDQPVRLWGWATHGVVIRATLEGETRSTRVTGNAWRLDFSPRPADGRVMRLEILADERLVRRIDDIVVGEVWLASGQSNMAMALGGTQGKAVGQARPADPLLRCFRVPAEVLEKTRPPLGTVWEGAAPGTVPGWTAVGYEFAYRLRESLKVPVGLVQCAQGATATESWASPELLARGWPAYEQFFAKADKTAWRPSLYPSECHRRLLSTVMPYPVRGVVWYQGEGNTSRAEEQLRLFPALVEDWRARWENPTMPFYFVQLARLERSDWHAFRDAQRRIAEALPHSFLAVTIDLPTDFNPKDNPIHPTVKQPIGERLALGALRQVYRLPGDEASGPRVREARRQGAEVALSFADAAGLRSADGKPLRGFAVAGADRRFVPAQARIEAEQVVLGGFGGIEPAWVRYGAEAEFAPGLIDVNVCNRAGLPASPFTVPVLP